MSAIFAYGYRYDWETYNGDTFLVRDLCTIGGVLHKVSAQQSQSQYAWEDNKVQFGRRYGDTVDGLGQEFGESGKSVYGFRISARNVEFEMMYHKLGGVWVEEIKTENGIAQFSSDSPIDAIAVKETNGLLDPISYSGFFGKRVYTQAHTQQSGWLPVVWGYSKTASTGYAGKLNEEIDMLRCFITFSGTPDISPPEESPEDPPEEDPSETEICPDCGEPLVDGVCQNADCPSNQQGDYVEE